MQQKRQTTFEKMREETPRKINGDNSMPGTNSTHGNNTSKLNAVSKLDECVSTLRSCAFDENYAMPMIKMCKDHLQKSHDVVNINLPKVNTETKEIINAIKRSDPNDYPGIPNPENVFPQLSKGIIFSQSNNPPTSDRNEVANTLLTINQKAYNQQNMF